MDDGNSKEKHQEAMNWLVEWGKRIVLQVRHVVWYCSIFWRSLQNDKLKFLVLNF